MHIIPAPKKLRKEDFKGKASLSYIMKKKKKNTNRKQTNKQNTSLGVWEVVPWVECLPSVRSQHHISRVWQIMLSVNGRGKRWEVQGRPCQHSTFEDSMSYRRTVLASYKRN